VERLGSESRATGASCGGWRRALGRARVRVWDLEAGRQAKPVAAHVACPVARITPVQRVAGVRVRARHTRRGRKPCCSRQRRGNQSSTPGHTHRPTARRHGRSTSDGPARVTLSGSLHPPNSAACRDRARQWDTICDAADKIETFRPRTISVRPRIAAFRGSTAGFRGRTAQASRQVAARVSRARLRSRPCGPPSRRRVAPPGDPGSAPSQRHIPGPSAPGAADAHAPTPSRPPPAPA